MRRPIVGLALAALLLAPGCDLIGGSADLDGSWVLVGGTHDGEPITPIEGTSVTLRIDGEEVGGTAACNIYGGSMERDGASISIGALSMTEMACDEPIMALESAYLAALSGVTGATRTGGALTLTGPGVQLDFELVPPEADADLIDTTWTLESLVTGDAVSSVMGDATLVLAEDGTLSGSTGCRSFGGDYEIDGTSLITGELVADLRACEDGLGAQDAEVLAVLDDDPTFSIEGARLSLRAGDRGLDYRTGD